MVDEDDQDVYVAQLREVFDSCDVKGDGFLTKDGLVELCQKLQLEDQLSKLLAQLLGDQEDGEVRFCSKYFALRQNGSCFIRSQDHRYSHSYHLIRFSSFGEVWESKSYLNILFIYTGQL